MMKNRDIDERKYPERACAQEVVRASNPGMQIRIEDNIARLPAGPLVKEVNSMGD